MNEYDPIDKALDVKSEIVREKRKISKRVSEQDDPTKDYEYSRGQLYNLVERTGSCQWYIGCMSRLTASKGI